MSSVTTIKTQEKPLSADTFPLREGHTGASSGAFPLSSKVHPIHKEIPTTRTPEAQLLVSSATSDAIGKAWDTASVFRSLYQDWSDTSHPANIVSDQAAAGFGAFSNLPRGVLKVVKGNAHLEKAQAIGDEEGESTARLEKVTGIFQTLGGATSIGARSTRIANALVSNKRLMVAGTALSFIGGIFSVILNSLFLGWAVRQSRRASHFYEEYKRQGKTFEALAGSIYVSSEKLHEWLGTEHRTSLRLTGLTALEKAGADAASARLRFAHLDPARKIAMWSALVHHFAQENPHLPAMAELYFSQLSYKDIDSLDLPTALGLLLKVSNEQLSNEAHFELAFGADCLHLVKKAAERGLQARMDPAAPKDVRIAAHNECAELLAKIDASYVKMQNNYKSTALLSLAGIGLGIVGFLTLGLVATAVVSAVGLVFNIIGAVQSWLTASEFKGPVAPHDRLFVIVMMAIGILGIAAAITAFCIFGGGPVVAAIFAIALVSGLLTLGIYAYTLHQLNKQDESWKKAHSNVDDLISRLSALRSEDALDDKTLKLLKQLPKDHRKAIVDEAALAAGRKRVKFNDLSDAAARDKLRRAVKRTAVFFWKQWWYSNKNPYFEQQAMALQTLLMSIEHANVEQAKHIYRHIEDDGVKEKLQEYFHKISASEASVKALSDAVYNFRAHQIEQTA
jgi:hypothetical protein